MKRFFVSWAIFMLSGCMSVYTRKEGIWQPYVGVAYDVVFLKERKLGWWGYPPIVLDVPLCFVIDTVLLPVDLIVQTANANPEMSRGK